MNYLYYIALVIIIVIIYAAMTSKAVEKFMTTEPTSKQTTYRHILAKTKETLDELGIPFFLSSGTCLGYVRERNFMDHDYDIDIGIDAKDYTPKIIDAMSKKGLYLYRVFGSLQTGMEMSFYLGYTPGHQRGKIDIFVHQDHGPKTCWFSYNKTKDKKLQYCVSKFDLEQVDFLGLKVNIPDPVKKYLEEHYGKDWRIPKGSGTLGEYNYSISPISLVS